MADRKVSELNAAVIGNLHPAALMHVVDLTEAQAADQNVKATIAEVRGAVGHYPASSTTITASMLLYTGWRTAGGASVEITIPTNATLAIPIGWGVHILALNTVGFATVTAASGVTLYSPVGEEVSTRTIQDHGTAYLYKWSTDSWAITGDLVAV